MSFTIIDVKTLTPRIKDIKKLFKPNEITVYMTLRAMALH